ncbi:hypothetical protein X739_30115 [Mesorhizobium sp. LNHC220B00]|nr:hypothetical protein X739_30115 [Mesorhizobium sp. LNHC220B00]
MFANESARVHNRRAAAQINDLRWTIEEPRRVIEESRKLLHRLAGESDAIGR